MFSIKKFLEDNKIFFEVLVSLSLTAMALYVSYQANRIAAVQTKISESENMPVFEVIASQTYDKALKFYTENIIDISNEGGPIYNFTPKAVTFLEVAYTDEQNGYTQKIERIPLVGYFTTSFVSNKTKGNMVTWQGYRNNLKLRDLEKEISQSAMLSNKFVSLEIKVYLLVSYEDFLRRAQVEYYYSSVTGTKKITNTEGEKAFKEYSDAAPGSLQEFTTLDKFELIKILKF